MKDKLQELLQSARIWRGRNVVPQADAVPTGCRRLDESLPDGGWPGRALTEIVTDACGLGELELVTPALARLSAGDRWIAWIAPPLVPYAPALAAAGVDLTRILVVRPRGAADVWWAMEQALRSGTCAAVLAWEPEAGVETADISPGRVRAVAAPSLMKLRRLQLAAEEGCTLGILFRPSRALRESSPAALRLRLVPGRAGLQLELLKSRGGRPLVFAEPEWRRMDGRWC